MYNQFEFEPSAQRAIAVNHDVHADLGRSIQYLCERCADVIPLDAQALAGVTDNLTRGYRYHPSVFSTYYDLVLAIINNDMAVAESAFAQLSKARPQESGLRVCALGSPAIEEHTARYRRLIAEDISLDARILPPSKQQAAAYHTQFLAGLALLHRVAPALAAEVEAIVHEVVIVAGDKQSGVQFDGGSHYQLWGALFLNCDFPREPHEMLEVIAHECAHSLLFGLSREQPLVENPEDELFVSPLRPDPRPMDGIFHATFVSARMHWATSQLLASGVLDASDHEQVAQACRTNAENFKQGYEVVARHGQLSQLGQALMSGAHAHVTACERFSIA